MIDAPVVPGVSEIQDEQDSHFSPFRGGRWAALQVQVDRDACFASGVRRPAGARTGGRAAGVTHTQQHLTVEMLSARQN